MNPTIPPKPFRSRHNHQLLLALEDATTSRKLPPPIREKCLVLFEELLRSIVPVEGEPDER